MGVREGIPVWRGMLCAALELVTIRKKKPVHLLYHSVMFERLSSDACCQCFGSSFNKEL